VIYEVTLSNGMGDHVDVVVEARCEIEAKKAAEKFVKSLDPYQRGCALNGERPDMVKVTLLMPDRDGVLKIECFDHEQGGYCF
jgi:hypothetical protein